MPGILDQCKQYFGSKDIYEILELTKDTATEKDIKKAYYKLSLKVHPDRVDEEEKDVATEKFKILSKVYDVLTNSSKKALYDERGVIDDDDMESSLVSWMELWKSLFKPISDEDITKYEKEFIGSDLERTDIKKAYLNGKGCINIMMECVPFMDVENEPRIAGIVQEMIDAGEVPEYEIFTNEPAQKKKKRHQHYARENRESRYIKKKLERQKKKNPSTPSLEQQIMKRQKDRSDSLFESLLSKYGDMEEDNSEVFDLKDLGKGKTKKKSRNPDSKPKDRKVRNGRVAK